MKRTFINYWQFEKDFHNGDFPTQRKGQAFCNRFEYRNPDLFYSTNSEFIRETINKYLETDFSEIEQ